MPGAKRKYDEDNWMGTQSKKFKCGQLLQNVYASTLAQLRMGARNFFNNSTAAAAGSSPHRNPNDNLGNQSPSPSSSRSMMPSSPLNSPPSSPLMRDILSDNDLPLFPPRQIQQPQDICFNCSSSPRRDEEGWEKCYYCDKVVCHLNPCEGCNEGYCSNCCITKYDNPSGETFACYGCLH